MGSRPTRPTTKTAGQRLCAPDLFSFVYNLVYNLRTRNHPMCWLRMKSGPKTRCFIWRKRGEISAHVAVHHVRKTRYHPPRLLENELGAPVPLCAVVARTGGMAWPKTIPSNGKEKSKENERMFEVWAPYSLMLGTGGIALGGVWPRSRRSSAGRGAPTGRPCRSCTASSPCNAGAVQTARYRRALDDVALLSPLCPMPNLGRLAAHMDGRPLFSRGGVCWTLPTTPHLSCDGVQSDACSLPRGRA